MFLAYKRWLDFKGRSGRREFWLFFLWMALTAIGAFLIDQALFHAGEAFAPLYWLTLLINIVPHLAVSVRRLHDTGNTGWWIVIGAIPFLGFLVLLVFFVAEGKKGTNPFGPPYGQPLGEDPDAVFS